MNFILKIMDFFSKRKNSMENFKVKIEMFIFSHREELKLLMNLFQTFYERGNGSAKMQQVVKTVCSAVGVKALGAEYADDVTHFIEEKCQQIYDELVAKGGLRKCGD